MYLTISEKYLSGSFYDALNAYWSPLVSWAILPFLFAGIDPLLSFKLMQIIIGIFTVNIWILLIKKININKVLKLGTMFVIIPLVIFYALFYGTPDLLFLTLLLYYFFCLFDEKYRQSNTYSVICGCLGALLYLAKSFGLPFFLVHFTLINVYYFFRISKDNVLKKIIFKRYIIGLCVFLILICPWVLALSNKYDSLIFSTAGNYNFSIIGPEITPDPYSILNHPARIKGITPPSSNTSSTSWEDPSLLTYPQWNPLSSNQNFNHYLKVIQKNFMAIYYNDFNLKGGTIFLIMYLMFFLLKRKNFKLSPIFWCLLGSMVFYSLSYAAILVMPRYIWLNSLIFLLLSMFILEAMNKNLLWMKILFLVMLAFTAKHSVQIFSTKINAFNNLSTDNHIQTKNLITRMNQASLRYDKIFEVINKTKGIIAANDRIITIYDKQDINLTCTHLISFYRKLQFYGELNEQTFKKDFNTLQEKNIKYLLTWHIPDGFKRLLNEKNLPLVFNDKESQLRIYQISN